MKKISLCYRFIACFHFFLECDESAYQNQKHDKSANQLVRVRRLSKLGQLNQGLNSSLITDQFVQCYIKRSLLPHFELDYSQV